MAAISAPAKADEGSLKAAVGIAPAGILLADLRSKLSDEAIDTAWASGEIQFGHRKYIVCGPVGTDESSIIVEDGYEWSGAKTDLHADFLTFADEPPPAVKRYRKYGFEMLVNKSKDIWEPVADVASAKGRETRRVPVDIEASEALAEIALRVRLTDKGRGRKSRS